MRHRICLRSFHAIAAFSICWFASQAWSAEVGDVVESTLNGKVTVGKVIDLLPGKQKLVIELSDGKKSEVEAASITKIRLPIDKPEAMRQWKNKIGEDVMKGVFLRQHMGGIYVQQQDGAVAIPPGILMSAEDNAFVDQNRDQANDYILQAGDNVEIGELQVEGFLNKDDTRKKIRDAVMRSGYRVGQSDQAVIKVACKSEDPIKKEVKGASGPRTIEFTPVTVTVTLTFEDQILWSRSETTQLPDSIPEGKTGDEILKSAKVPSNRFLSQIPIPVRFPKKSDSK